MYSEQLIALNEKILYLTDLRECKSIRQINEASGLTEFDKRHIYSKVEQKQIYLDFLANKKGRLAESIKKECAVTFEANEWRHLCDMEIELLDSLKAGLQPEPASFIDGLAEMWRTDKLAFVFVSLMSSLMAVFAALVIYGVARIILSL